MAKICLICEGSYPYVVGGVSSWIQDLIRSNEEHEFSILCIIPSEEFAQVKYDIPKNVSIIKNVFLDKNYEAKNYNVFKNRYNLTDEINKKLKRSFDFKNIKSHIFFQLIDEFSKKKYGNPLEIVISKRFWEMMVEYYNENYKGIEFNIFYWTYRNIFLNLISLSQEELPKADIYHPVATGYSGYLGALAGFRKMGKVVLTEHGIYPREREEEVIGANWIEKNFKSIWINFFYFLSKLTYDYSDRVITLFNHNKNLQIEIGADAKKCFVIPNGIDSKVYNEIEYIKKPGFNIGSVLRVVPIKDVKMMLKGYKVALSRLKDAHLYLIGPTEENEEYYKECLQLAKDLGLEPYITFTGRVNVKEYYNFLDLLLLTSLSEGQPLSILEGLASGIPFISTDVGNCREILREKYDIGEAGLIVPPTAYVELGEAIVFLYQNRDKLNGMKEVGKKIVEKYYTKESFIKSYKKIYEDLSEEEKWQE